MAIRTAIDLKLFEKIKERPGEVISATQLAEQCNADKQLLG